MRPSAETFYEIRVRGLLGPATLNAFSALASGRRDGDTVLSGALPDQAALCGVLHQIESLGLDLIAVRRQSEERSMPPQLDGIHHITAITADARRNFDFYARVLGLRLVARSVNQDDPSVYHLVYGDELARPGSHLTFFEQPRAQPGRVGAGMVHRIAWRVASASGLDFWQRRLTDEASPNDRSNGSLRFVDPDGLAHELAVDDSGDQPLIAEHPEVPTEHAIAGIAGVHAFVPDPVATAGWIEGMLGAEPRPQSRWELRGAYRGGWVELHEGSSDRGHPGAGTIHHVAWTTTDAEQGQWLARLNDAGVPNSGIIDRYAFQSLYFRVPGGVLFELATEEPGFTIDTPVEELGRHVILPPWLEPRRSEIEARLTPLADSRAQ